MKVKDEEDYLNKVYKSVEISPFYICKEILLILNYEILKLKCSSKNIIYQTNGFILNSWQIHLNDLIYHII